MGLAEGAVIDRVDIPKISVIVPVHNTESFLRNCLDSIVEQSYSNLEILLVDDGSTDRSGSICDIYAAMDSRIRVFHQQNNGVAAARNIGLIEAQGEWVSWIDSDDWIEKEFYKSLLGTANLYQADIVQTGMVIESEKEKRILFTVEPVEVYSNGLLAYNGTGPYLVSNSTCNKIYRTALVKEIQYNINFPIGEDLLFNLYALERAGIVVLTSSAKYHYVQHENSACNAIPDKVRLTSFRNMLLYAQKKFAVHLEWEDFFVTTYWKNNLDMASRISCFGIDWADRLVKEMQKELCGSLFYLLGKPQFSPKDKIKLALIFTLGQAYTDFLTVWKRIFVQAGS